jgi:hypothetical protein
MAVGLIIPSEFLGVFVRKHVAPLFRVSLPCSHTGAQNPGYTQSAGGPGADRGQSRAHGLDGAAKQAFLGGRGVEHLRS